MGQITTEELVDTLKTLDKVCYSGGAEGADLLFGIWAEANGFQELHFSFNKHKHHVRDETVLVLPDSILQDPEVKNVLRNANYSLGRSVPKPGSYTYNLLARNRFQVLLTERVYCISPLESPSMVSGGTAWAVQMYIDMYENPEIYCYDNIRHECYKYCTVQKAFVEVETVPTPYGNWTGIGSRKATQEHMDAFTTYFR
jgi:hypothetical protein